MKEFADDNCEFDQNGRKVSKWIEKTVGKGEIARYEQFLLFLQCFLKTCTAVPMHPQCIQPANQLNNSRLEQVGQLCFDVQKI